eukprot:2079430-Rhodomonas_salina.5
MSPTASGTLPSSRRASGLRLSGGAQAESGAALREAEEWRHGSRRVVMTRRAQEQKRERFQRLARKKGTGSLRPGRKSWMRADCERRCWEVARLSMEASEARDARPRAARRWKKEQSDARRTEQIMKRSRSAENQTILHRK